jgi:hypothetical protein|tara:strand:- start:577 stop:741 length:165 start_codon:yes stop_codon:yes gene_type:complete
MIGRVTKTNRKMSEGATKTSPVSPPRGRKLNSRRRGSVAVVVARGGPFGEWFWM